MCRICLGEETLILPLSRIYLLFEISDCNSVWSDFPTMGNCWDSNLQLSVKPKFIIQVSVHEPKNTFSYPGILLKNCYLLSVFFVFQWDSYCSALFHFNFWRFQSGTLVTFSFLHQKPTAKKVCFLQKELQKNKMTSWLEYYHSCKD